MKTMGRWVKSIATGVVSMTLLPVVSACSMVSCLDDGIELRRNFVISIKHDGKALPGVGIKVETDAPNNSVVFQAMTDAKGTATVLLSPGNYWLRAEYLGNDAAYHCFHVKKHSGLRAKGKLTYDWGDPAPGVRQIAGRITESKPGTGGTLLWNLSHPVVVPITGATLRLQNAITHASFSTESDVQGYFAFGELPNGTYVLHVEAGFAANDILLKVSQTAKRDEMTLKREESGCGGTVIVPDWN